MDNTIDPVFVTLESLSGIVTDDVEHSLRAIPDMNLLAEQLESGLVEKLVESWAKHGLSSVTSNHFIDLTNRLRKLIQLTSTMVSCTRSISTLIRVIVENHMTLIYRGLYTQKPSTVIPPVRLLHSMVNFNRGRQCDEVYNGFDFTIKVLPKLLQPGPASISKAGDTSESQKKVKNEATNSNRIRDAVVQLLSSFMQLGSCLVRESILTHRRLFIIWLKHLHSDNSYLIEITISSFTAVLLDKNVTKSKKVALFNEWILGRMLAVVREPNVPEKLKSETKQFLRSLCLNTQYGIGFEDAGWYSPGYFDKERSKGLIVHNRTILGFIKLLDIDDDFERIFLLEIFSTYTELVAPYMSQGAFSLDAKLNEKFLRCDIISAVVDLPVPPMILDFSVDIPVPPVTDNVLENIIPSPLSRPFIIQSMQQNDSSLICYAVIQILQKVIRKLNTIIDIYDRRGWLSEKFALIEEIYRKLPDINSYVSLLNGGSDVARQGELYRTALSKLLCLYVDTFPEVSIDAKIDLTSALMRVLDDIGLLSENPNVIKHRLGGVNLLLFRNLLRVQSSIFVTSKWWNATEGRCYSLFIYLIKLAISINNTEIFQEIMNVLVKMSTVTLLFQHRTAVYPLYILVKYLQSDEEVLNNVESQMIWSLLNESVARCLRSPYRYIDKARTMKASSKSLVFSPFCVSLLEQWKYITDSNPSVDKKRLGRILTKVLSSFCMAGEDWQVGIGLVADIESSCTRAAGDTLQKTLAFLRLCSGSEPASVKNSLSTSIFSTIADPIFTFTDKILLGQIDPEHDLSKISVLEIFACFNTIFRESINENVRPLLRFWDFQHQMLHALNNTDKEHVLNYILNEERWLPLFWRNELTGKKREISVIMTKYYYRCLSTLLHYSNIKLSNTKDFPYNYLLSTLSEKIDDIELIKSLETGLRLLHNDDLLKLLQMSIARGISNTTAHIVHRVLDSLFLTEDLVIDSNLINNVISLSTATKHYDILKGMDRIVYLCDIKPEKINAEVLLSCLNNEDASAFLLRLMNLSISISGMVIECLLAKKIEVNELQLTNILKVFAKHCCSIDEEHGWYIWSIEKCPCNFLTLYKEFIRNIRKDAISIDDLDFYERLVAILENDDDYDTFYRNIVKSFELSAIGGRIELTLHLLRTMKTTDFILEESKFLLQSTLLQITKFLSESKELTELHLKIINITAEFLEDFSGLFSLGKNVNPPIEVGLAKWLAEPEVVKLMLRLITMSNSSQLEYRKFLQMICYNNKIPLLYKESYSERLIFDLVCMIHRLYFLNPEANIDKQLMVRILLFQGASCSPADILLVDVLRHLEHTIGISVLGFINSYRFGQQSSSFSNPMFELNQNNVEACFNGRQFGISVKCISEEYMLAPKTSFGQSSKIYETFWKATQNLENKSQLYHPLIVLPFLMDMVYNELVDVKLLVDNNCISYIIVCLSLDSGASLMARKILGPLIKMVEDSYYKERDILKLLLYKIYTSLMSKNEGPVISHDKLIEDPTKFSHITTSFLANLVSIVTNPGHLLYDKILNYLTGSYRFDFDPSKFDTPILRSLIPSATINGATRETNWVLNIVTTGLKNKEDLLIFQRSFIFEIIQTIATGVYTAESTRKIATDLLSQARYIASA
ncbi:ribosome 60S biogenesis N-terminal-domain-containing protein [Dipodascopsis uninucleata]